MTKGQRIWAKPKLSVLYWLDLLTFMVKFTGSFHCKTFLPVPDLIVKKIHDLNVLEDFMEWPLFELKISALSLSFLGQFSIMTRIWKRNLSELYCTEVRFVSFLSGWFTTMTVIDPPERKLGKRTSVYWCKNQ